MSAKGSYLGDYYIPVDYSNSGTLDKEIIAHELAHALLTESTSHGLAYFEFSSLLHENYDNVSLGDTLKLLRDASQRTEECFAVLMPILENCSETEQLQEQYSILQKNEYYHRFRICQFDSILFANVSIAEKKEIITNIFYAAMNTNIFDMDLEWDSPKSVYDTFKSHAVYLIPDKRLNIILTWVNKHLHDCNLFSLKDTEIHRKALGYPMPMDYVIPLDIQMSGFRKKIIAMANEKQLIHNYIKDEKSSKVKDYSDRIYYQIEDTSYTTYVAELPDMCLFDCEVVYYFPLEYVEILLFTSLIHKKKYKLGVPPGVFAENMLNNFNGTIIAYLDDIGTLSSKLINSPNRKIIYKSICGFEHLEYILQEHSIVIVRAGVLQYDSKIGSPFFVDQNGVFYSGGLRSLDVLLRYKKYPLDIISPKMPIFTNGLVASQFYSISASDDTVDKLFNPPDVQRVVFRKGQLNQKENAQTVGIGVFEVCTFYFEYLKSAIATEKWEEAQGVINFLINYFSNHDDRITALQIIDDGLSVLKKAMISDIKKSHKLMEQFAGLYSMIIQGYEQLDAPDKCMCVTLTNWANLYAVCGFMGSANHYAEKALQLKLSIYGEDTLKVAYGYYLLGITLEHTDPNRAGEYFYKAKKIAIKYNDKRLITISEHALAKLDDK